MAEAKIVEWRVPVGGQVSSGDEVVDIETEKIAAGVEARDSGVLRRHIAKEEEVLPVGGLLAVISDADTPESEIDAFVANYEVTAPDQIGSEGDETADTIDVNGRAIRYLRRGDSGSAVVLIHGFGGDLNNWLFNHEPLAAEHVVYALDLPGHGASSIDVGDGSLDEFARTLSDFISALDIAPAHLVGHSMGGAIALTFAVAHPDLTSSLTLIGSAGLGPEIDTSYLDGFVQARKRKDMKPHLEKLFSDPSLITRQLVEDVLKFKRLDGVQDALATVAEQLFPGGLQSAGLRDQLDTLKLPAQVIWGEEDRIIPPVHARGLSADVATHTVASAGHMVQMEAPAEVNRLIRQLAS
jgi:pyruvate dehydrogenase E2 component (dihydrolipoamide acetyltransferase)